MKRRTFIKTATAAAAVAAVSGSLNHAKADHHHRQQYLAWWKYVVDTPQQKGVVERFLKNAAIPGLNRLGSKPVGVFYDKNDPQDLSIYTLIPFPSLESMTGAKEALGADGEFMENAREYLGTPKSAPAYQRIEISHFKAFSGFPTVQAPLTGERIFELRVYESHNELKGVLKVELCNEAELDIFEKVGLDGVFYGEAIAGTNLPNLTYMIAYKNMEERKAAWGRFVKHPDWLILKEN